MATNPVLNEINGLSPGAKTALLNAHQASSPPATPAPIAGLHAPSQIPTTPMMGVTPPPSVDTKGLASATATPPPSLSAPSAPNVALSPSPRGTLIGDQEKLSHDLSTGSGISQIHSKIENSSFGQKHPFLGKLAGWGAQIPAQIADIGVSALAPAITMNTPGTEYHHLRDIKQDQGQIAGDTANEEKQAQTGLLQANTGKTAEETQEMPALNASTEARNNAAAQKDLATPDKGWKLTNQYVGPHGEPVETNEQGQVRIAPNLPQGITRFQAPPKEPTEGPKPVEINGKPGYAVFNPGKGWSDTQGNPIQGDVRPIPPPPNFASIYPMVTGGRATDAATTHWQQEAGQYQGALNTLAQAKTGSELSASLVPLGIALTTPTAAGVHRINTAEIAQAGPQIGSLARRLDAALEKAGSGAIPPDTIREAEQFVKMYQNLKYHGYLAQVKQASDTFRMGPDQTFVTSMDGQSEMPLSEAVKQNTQQPSDEGGASGGIEVKAPDGKSYSFKDQAAADKFKAAAGIK